MPTPPSQITDETGSEQSRVKKDLITAFDRLRNTLSQRHSGNQKTEPRELWTLYRTHDVVAQYHRTAAHAQDQILDLDTATADEITHLEVMSDHEKQASDTYHAILKIMRADRISLDEIEESSREILLLAHETPYCEHCADMVEVILNSIERERENMESFLTNLLDKSQWNNRYNNAWVSVKD